MTANNFMLMTLASWSVLLQGAEKGNDVRQIPMIIMHPTLAERT